MTSFVPSAQWQQNAVDSMNAVLALNDAPIHLMIANDDPDAMPLVYVDSIGVGSYGVGSIGSDVKMVNQSGSNDWRLLLHEIGHALGLLHPWGFCTISEPTCDDGISDTPWEPVNCDTTRNIMSYNQVRDYLSPGQISALVQHLTTDVHINGMYMPDYGISIMKWARKCPVDLSTENVTDDCPSVLVSIIDMAGRQLLSKPENQVFVEIFRRCDGSFYSKKSFRLP